MSLITFIAWFVVLMTGLLTTYALRAMTMDPRDRGGRWLTQGMPALALTANSAVFIVAYLHEKGDATLLGLAGMLAAAASAGAFRATQRRG